VQTVLRGQFGKRLPAIAAGALLSLIVNPGAVIAQVSQKTIESLSTPDSVETSIGTLEFKDGAPTVESAEKVRDALLFTRALNVYNNSFRGALAYAIREGLRAYACYYNYIRTHRSLDKDAPVSRLVQRTGAVRSHGILGGLHHHNVRI
jgi:hypothetical protein